MDADQFRKTSDYSNQIIARLLAGLLECKENSNAELSFGDAPITWDYQSALYYAAGDLWNAEFLTNSVPMKVWTKDKDLQDVCTYDMIFADLPLGNRRGLTSHLENAAGLLSPDGVLVGVFHNFETIRLLLKNGTCAKLGIFPSGVLQLNKGFLDPVVASIAPVICCFLKRNIHNLTCFMEYKEENSEDNITWFIERHRGSELRDENDYKNYVEVAARTKDYLLNTIGEVHAASDDNLDFGFFEALEHFVGFDLWKFISPFETIDTDYNYYRKVYLGEVVKEINLNRTEFVSAENAIYLPLIGPQRVIEDLSETKLKHQNLCQIIVDDEIITPRYLTTYLHSDFGQIFWGAAIVSKPGVIKRLSKADVAGIIISVPPLELQKKIVETSTKIENAVSALEEIKNSLTRNPISSKQHLQKLNSILKTVNEVSPLLREESIIHEFKASLRTPYPDPVLPEKNDKGQQIYKLDKQTFSSEKQLSKFIERISLKAIASLLNTRGGTLVIGVHEQGNKKEVVGIDYDGFKSHDDYERHLAGILENAFNPLVVSEFISTRIEELIEGKFVCVVTCEPMWEMVRQVAFLDDEVWKRTGPRVVKLTTEQVFKLTMQKK